MTWNLNLSAATLLLLGCACASRSGSEYAKHYLNDPGTSVEFKTAIKERVVVQGMCPFQAFAAAGLPNMYKVTADRNVWGADVAPPDIIDAQCEHPDGSVIELMFENKFQFKSKAPIEFRVRFMNGKAVLIDRKRFNED